MDDDQVPLFQSGSTIYNRREEDDNPHGIRPPPSAPIPIPGHYDVGEHFYTPPRVPPRVVPHRPYSPDPIPTINSPLLHSGSPEGFNRLFNPPAPRRPPITTMEQYSSQRFGSDNCGSSQYRPPNYPQAQEDVNCDSMNLSNSLMFPSFGGPPTYSSPSPSPSSSPIADITLTTSPVPIPRRRNQSPGPYAPDHYPFNDSTPISPRYQSGSPNSTAVTIDCDHAPADEDCTPPLYRNRPISSLPQRKQYNK